MHLGMRILTFVVASVLIVAGIAALIGGIARGPAVAWLATGVIFMWYGLKKRNKGA
jgi:hypothetical protein